MFMVTWDVKVNGFFSHGEIREMESLEQALRVKKELEKKPEQFTNIQIYEAVDFGQR